MWCSRLSEVSRSSRTGEPIFDSRRRTLYTRDPDPSLCGMPPIPPPRASGFTQATTVPLYWCGYGPEDAPPVLLLHGGPGASHEYLLPQMLELAKEHRVVCYDQRGGGRSRHDDDRATIG